MRARGIFLLFSFLLSPIFFLSEAGAVQAGGSISLFPTDWGRLVVGSKIFVVVTVNNTSSDTPASSFPDDGVDPVPAVFNGGITVLLACLDHDCTSQASGKLQFVGCSDLHPRVASCGAAGSDAVVITIKPQGIPLPANGSVDVATLELDVINTDNVAELGLKAMSDPGAIRACSSSVPEICASCDATGCTTLLLGPLGPPIGCPHACPERIIFRGDADTPDFFEFHGLIRPNSILDPPAEDFRLRLSNPLRELFAFSLPQGSFKQQGVGTFTYKNDDARKQGGIAFVKISRRDGPGVEYKIDIQALDAGLETNATEPVMTVEFEIGDDPFKTTNTWTKKKNGWFLNLPR